MAQTQRIVISARPAVNVTVDLIGTEYVIPAPKTTVGLIIAERMQAANDDPKILMAELKDWIEGTFGEKHVEEIWARLFDPKDPLDIPDVADLIRQLSELGANPTT